MLYRSSKIHCGKAKMTAQQTKKIIINTDTTVGTENGWKAISVFNIESDDIKVESLVVEGRNIRALETATGVEIIGWTTRQKLSSYRVLILWEEEIARLALHKLVTTDVFTQHVLKKWLLKLLKQIDEEIVETGKRTVIDWNPQLHPELIKVVEWDKMRSSYGQNLLQHSRSKLSCVVSWLLN